MADPARTKYEDVTAAPAKSFFVSMLTRDIELEDAILDLLDNCVDGILRSGKTESDKPYHGFWAEIGLKPDLFSLSDNCGGIPWSFHKYAFMMGRPHDYEPTVTGNLGVYGIGMKRAIFKIGRYCLISTRSGKDEYEIEIPKKWFEDESDWDLHVKATRTSMKEEGTTILVGNLNPGIAEQFAEGAESFKSRLEQMIAKNYAYIIEKGFEVKINGNPIKPRTTKIVFDNREETSIRPYIFKSSSNGLDVFLTVGFTRPIPSQNEILDEQESTRYSSVDAGWTVLCNDRAVLYADKTEMTGWGEAGVPRYHTQFIAISGIVEFRSDDARKLPTTTTKRGIDASSPVYLQIKNKMREGMRIFTDYTNRWKTREDESKKQIQKGVRLSLAEIKSTSTKIQFNATTRTIPPGEQYKPKLPLPPVIEPARRRISFVKDIYKIKRVAEFLGDSDLEPSEVGEKCFDTVYEEVR
jgi:hypothetical protein